MLPKKLNVIVGLDFSEFSCYALDHAVGLSKYVPCKLHLTYIIESDSMISEMLDKIRIEAEQWFERKLLETTKRFALTLPEYEIHILTGKASEQLLLLSKELEANFIFLGFSSNQELNQKNMGSNVSKLIPRTGSPICILKESDNHKPFTDIVFPIKLKSYETDFNDNRALKYAMRFMKRFSQMTIHLVSVLHDKEDFEINKAAQLLLSIQEVFEKNGIKTNAEIIKYHKSEDKTSDVIADYTHRIGADILFLGQSDKNSISIASQSICNKVNIPIIVIK